MEATQTSIHSTVLKKEGGKFQVLGHMLILISKPVTGDPFPGAEPSGPVGERVKIKHV